MMTHAAMPRRRHTHTLHPMWANFIVCLVGPYFGSRHLSWVMQISNLLGSICCRSDAPFLRRSSSVNEASAMLGCLFERNGLFDSDLDAGAESSRGPDSIPPATLCPG